MAKNAAISGSPCKLLPPSEMVRVVKQSSLDDWNFHDTKFFNNPFSSYLTIQPQLPIKPWYTHLKDVRRTNSVKLSRLRFGYNLLPIHLHRIGHLDSSKCPLHPHSPIFPFSLDHLFFECAHLHNIRNTQLRNTSSPYSHSILSC